MRRFVHILLMTIAAVTGSCTLRDSVMPLVDGSVIEFSSSKLRVVTKSGDQTQKFTDGTRYSLFAVARSDGDHDWSEVVMYNRSAVESSGFLDYGDKLSYGLPPCNVLDFYGITYDSSDPVAIIGEVGSAPMAPVEIISGVLPDMMFSDNLKVKNSSAGVLNMEFRHTMSKLKFEIMKQDETGTEESEMKLKDAVLKKVELKGTGVSGIFNVEKGLWEDVEVQDRVIYDSSLQLTTEAQSFASMIAMPADGDVSLRIYLDGIVDGDEYVDYTLAVSEGTPLRLKQNHEYTFSIAVLKNDVRIVAVTPKVYDWIDVELGNVAYFGQPVYFGDLVWMDRNLGASSADCENDWYNTIGYYYQHGRNVPYMLDVNVWKKYYNTASKVSFSGERFDNGLIYTIDNNGQRTSDYISATGASSPAATHPYYDQVAKNPGDVGVYSFICGFHSWSSWARDYNNGGDVRNDVYWNDPDNHPCPKGWRLPTRKDMYKYLPEEYNDIAKWQNKYTHGREIRKDYLAGNRNSLGEEYQWKYFSAMFKVDSSADGEWSYPVSDGYSRVYLIKYEGTGRAYRILIEQKRANTVNDGSVVKKYVRVSRFDTSQEDRFLISPDGKQWNLHKFDWDHPAEYMDFPLCGYIDSGDGTNTVVSTHPYLGAFGNGCILRSSEVDFSYASGRNWTMYFMDTYRGVTVGGGSRRTLGDQVRCVRDINAK